MHSVPLKLLLLPGMDGTGRLFAPFVEQLPPDVSTKVVSYPADRVMGYDDLLPLVERQIKPSVRHVVLGESFSGPLAVEYACRRRDDVAAIVLCASFLANPLPRLLRWLPKLARPSLATLAARRTLLRMSLLDFRTPADLVSEVHGVVRTVEPRVMTARMRAVASVDVTARLIELQIPILYLASGRDRVIGRRGERQVVAAAPHAEVQVLDAPHLILQTRPREAATVVSEFLKTV